MDNYTKLELQGKPMKTFFARGKRMWKYPAASTIERLRKQGTIMILWRNGDFIII